MSEPAGRAVLVFQAGGRRLAVSLEDLLGVEPANISALPLAEEAHLGLMKRQETIFPVFDPLELLRMGRMRTSPQLVILMEIRGCSIGLACQRVEGGGVLEGELDPVPGGAERKVAGWPATLLDLDSAVAERMSGG